MKTIKELVLSIIDNGEKYAGVKIPMGTVTSFMLLAMDKYPDDKDFIVAVNGTRFSSWPEIIPCSSPDGRFSDIESVLKFFNDAGAPVLAYRMNGVDTILNVPAPESSGHNYMAFKNTKHES